VKIISFIVTILKNFYNYKLHFESNFLAAENKFKKFSTLLKKN